MLPEMKMTVGVDTVLFEDTRIFGDLKDGGRPRCGGNVGGVEVVLQQDSIGATYWIAATDAPHGK
jgi:hypothetical protein